MRKKPLGKAKPEPRAVPSYTLWEAATGVPDAAMPGLVDVRVVGRLTLGVWLLLALVLWPAWGLAGVLMGLLFARLVALDLTTYTLPNIYTVPLLCVGLFAAWGEHLFMTLLIWAALALLGFGMRYRPAAGLGMGEGDLKLIAAMLAFLGPIGCLGALAAGCLLWLPFTFAVPRQPLPLGVPLVLGWVAVLAFPGLPAQLFSPIAF